MDFLSGVKYLLDGFTLVTQPQFRRFIIIPLIINIVLFVALLALAVFWFRDLIHWLEHFLPTWLHWLQWLFWVIAILGLLIFWVYFSTVIVNAVSGPFNSQLSEKITTYYLGDLSSERSFLLEVPLAIKRETQLILFYIPRAIIFLLCFLIPVLQIFAPILWFGFNAWVLTMQYLDYPMDNHKIDVREMRNLLRKKPSLNLGFGSAVVVLTMIPFLNFIAMPIAVAGGSLLWIKEYWPLTKT